MPKKQAHELCRRTSDAHNREIVRCVREFLAYASLHPLHRFAAGTRKLIEEVRPLVEQLDAIGTKSTSRNS